jgi:hypothetical protein
MSEVVSIVDLWGFLFNHTSDSWIRFGVFIMNLLQGKVLNQHKKEDMLVAGQELEFLDNRNSPNRIHGVMMWLPDGMVGDIEKMAAFIELYKWIKQGNSMDVTVMLCRVDEGVPAFFLIFLNFCFVCLFVIAYLL